MTMQIIHGDGCGSLSIMAKLNQLEVQHMLSSKRKISKQGCHTITDAIVNNSK